MSKLVYLAGGISGLTFDEAINWRKHVASHLPAGMEVLSPLRDKGYLKDTNDAIKDCYSEYTLSTGKVITCRDRNDIIRCDAVLVNFIGATRPSLGTAWEIGFADALRKPVVIAMEKSNVHNHAILRESAGCVVETLDEAIHIVGSLLRNGV